MSAASGQREIVDATDEEIDAIVAEFGQVVQESADCSFPVAAELALDTEAAVSRGYVRGRLLPFKLEGRE